MSDPTVFVLLGRWKHGDDPHVIGVFHTRAKAMAHAQETLNAKTDPMLSHAPSHRAEAWIAGEYWIQ